MESVDWNQSRIELNSRDTIGDVLRFSRNPNLETLQFRELLPAKLLEGLNQEFFPQRPDVQLRAYAFSTPSCDLCFCSLLTNVRRFCADFLPSVENVGHISKMSRLQSLTIGIWNLDSLAFLNDLNDGITELRVAETTKKLDLSPIVRFSKLQKLTLLKQQKNIQIIAQLNALESLSLTSVSVASLEMIRHLPRLNSLRLKLGGTKDISALSDINTIRQLELIKVLGLDSLSSLSGILGLEHLFLEKLCRVTSIPDVDKLTKLRKVHLADMKNLTDISALAKAPALEVLIHESSQLSVEAYLPILKQAHLREAHVGFGSPKKNERFRQLCLQHGVAVEHTGRV